MVVAFTVSAVVFGIAYLYISLAVTLQQASLSASQQAQQNSTAVVASDLQQEMNSSAQYGFVLGSGAYASQNASGCSLQLIGGCNNNAPSQFVCVNSAYVGNVSGQYARLYSQQRVCPAYMLPGTLGCGVSGGYCVVTRTQAAPESTT